MTAVLSPRTDAPVDWVCPIQWTHPLNRGLISWWLALPGSMGGGLWPDLCNQRHGTIGALVPQSAWGNPAPRMGGWGALTWTLTAGEVVTNTRLIGTLRTVSLWFRATSLSGNKRLHQWGTNGFSANASGADLQIIYDGTTTDTLYDVVVGRWTHYAATMDGANVTVYIDGVQFLQVADTASDTARQFYIGNTTGAGAQPFSGQIDDVHIWNRALSAVEVANLYQESRQGYPGCLRRIPRMGWLAEVAAPEVGQPMRLRRTVLRQGFSKFGRQGV